MSISPLTSPLPSIESAVARVQQAQQNEAGMAVLKKSLDMQKTQGEGLASMLDAAAEFARSLGKGRNIDVCV